MLFDLIRDSKSYSNQVLIDILTKFRDCKVFTDFNYFGFEEALFHERISCDYALFDLIDEIRESAQERKEEKEWDW